VDAIHAAGGPTTTPAILLFGISATTTAVFYTVDREEEK
jgi:hypothetical protein